MVNSIIVGTGSYLPEKILTNFDLEKMVDTNDEWIQTRTGIKQRHIAREGELTSDMVTVASKRAIESAGLSKDDIDLIIVATTTPDKTFPSTAVIAQSKLGIKNAAAFDIQAVCSGFVYALSIADKFIKSGQAKNALVIGADKMSSILNWEDRGTCILFGDGAGAVVLSATEEARGIFSTHLYSDGEFSDILYTDGGVTESGKAGHVVMLGQEVFKHAVEKMGNSIKTELKLHNLTVNDIDFLVPHQANSRIIEMIGKKLRLPEGKVIVTVGNHANTSAASIPLALDEANRKNLLKKNQIIALTALGAGLTWGSALLRW